MDVVDRADLPFPRSLPEFQRLFPDDAACAAYLEKAAGETALAARTAARRESRSTLKTALASCAAASAARTPG